MKNNRPSLLAPASRRTITEEPTGVLLEKAHFLGRALPSQGGIPFGEPPKLADGVAMGLCMLDAPGDKGAGELVVGELAACDQCFGKGDARDLRHDRLVVHQGHVEEQRLDHAAVAGCVCVWMVWMMVVVVVVDVNDMDEPVEFARDGRHRDPACLCVGGVRLLRVPVDVAGELVQ